VGDSISKALLLSANADNLDESTRMAACTRNLPYITVHIAATLILTVTLYLPNQC